MGEGFDDCSFGPSRVIAVIFHVVALCQLPTWRGTSMGAGCGTLEVGRATDGGIRLNWIVLPVVIGNMFTKLI